MRVAQPARTCITSGHGFGSVKAHRTAATEISACATRAENPTQQHVVRLPWAVFDFVSPPIR